MGQTSSLSLLPATSETPVPLWAWSGPLRGPLFGLAPDGVFRASALALGAVGSYPTFSPLPKLKPAVVDRRYSFRRFKFLWHCPSAGLAAWPPAYIPFPPPYVGGYRLRGIAPCGVRTFLPRLAPEAVLRPSKIKEQPTSLSVRGRKASQRLAFGVFVNEIPHEVRNEPHKL